MSGRSRPACLIRSTVDRSQSELWLTDVRFRCAARLQWLRAHHKWEDVGGQRVLLESWPFDRRFGGSTCGVHTVCHQADLEALCLASYVYQQPVKYTVFALALRDGAWHKLMDAVTIPARLSEEVFRKLRLVGGCT